MLLSTLRAAPTLHCGGSVAGRRVLAVASPPAVAAGRARRQLALGAARPQLVGALTMVQEAKLIKPEALPPLLPTGLPTPDANGRRRTPGLNAPSDEQRALIEAVRAGHNAHVPAVPGAGKTTAALSMAAECRDKLVVIIAYNRGLMEDTRKKAAEAGLDNVVVFTYHSLCCALYGASGTCRDSLIRINVLNIDAPLVGGLLTPEKEVVVVVDEAQDMLPTYHDLTCKLLRDVRAATAAEPQIVVLGDERQCVYGFKGADARFLTLASEVRRALSLCRFLRRLPCRRHHCHRCAIAVHRCLRRSNEAVRAPPHHASALPDHPEPPRRQVFPPNGREWRSVDLSLSHRLTRHVAACVNHCTGDEDGIRSQRDSEILVRLLADRDALQVAEYLIEHFKARGYAPGDIMILAKSLDCYPQKSYVKALEKALALRGWPVALPSQGERGSEACERGKVLFSTFAAAKGRERKCAVVLGFDDSYLRKGAPPVCGSDLYVALTRPKEELVLVQLDERHPLPFAPPQGAPYVERVPPPPPKGDDDEQRKPKPKRAADRTTSLLRFQSDDALEEAEAHVPSWMECADHLLEALPLPTEVKQLWRQRELGEPAERGGASETELSVEFVGDLNGAALLLLLLDSLGAPLGEAAAVALADIRHMRCSPEGPLTVAEALEAALRLDAKATGRIHRLKQITRFDWLPDATAEECVARLREHLALILGVASGGELDAAAQLWLKFDHELRADGAAAAAGLGGPSNGFADIYDAKSGAPISVVFANDITEEHRLRVTALASLAGSAVGFLLNPLKGEVWKMTATPEQQQAAVDVLDRHKKEGGASERLSDAEFIEDCRGGERR